MKYFTLRTGLCAILLTTTSLGVVAAHGAPAGMEEGMRRKYDIMQQQADTDRIRAEAERARSEAERAQIESQTRSNSSSGGGWQSSQGVQSGGVVRMVDSDAPQPIGLGVLRFGPSENARDIKSIRLMADQGNVDAQLSLGMRYIDAKDVEKNKAEAAKWLLPLAEKGAAQAQFAMGLLFYPGNIEDMNESMNSAIGDDAQIEAQQRVLLSEKWFRLAAQQGMAQAQYNLAVLHDADFGIDQNYAEAMKWYKLASAQGVAAAQLNLSRLYLQGRGSPKNFKAAYVWALMAYNQGGLAAQFAEQSGGLAKEHLSATQLQLARSAASRCLASNYQSCD